MRRGELPVIIDTAGGMPLQVTEPVKAQSVATPGPGVVERPTYTPGKRVFTILNLNKVNFSQISRQEAGTQALGEQPARRSRRRPSSQG